MIEVRVENIQSTKLTHTIRYEFYLNLYNDYDFPLAPKLEASIIIQEEVKDSTRDRELLFTIKLDGNLKENVQNWVEALSCHSYLKLLEKTSYTYGKNSYATELTLRLYESDLHEIKENS